MEFTPGPWKAHKLPKSDWLPKRWEIHYSADGECVAEIVHEDADAQLIAAAPDMYYALWTMMTAIPELWGDHVIGGRITITLDEAHLERIEAALKKAETGK